MHQSLASAPSSTRQGRNLHIFRGPIQSLTFCDIALVKGKLNFKRACRRRQLRKTSFIIVQPSIQKLQSALHWLLLIFWGKCLSLMSSFETVESTEKILQLQKNLQTKLKMTTQPPDLKKIKEQLSMQEMLLLTLLRFILTVAEETVEHMGWPSPISSQLTLLCMPSVVLLCISWSVTWIKLHINFMFITVEETEKRRKRRSRDWNLFQKDQNNSLFEKEFFT